MLVLVLQRFGEQTSKTKVVFVLLVHSFLLTNKLYFGFVCFPLLPDGKKPNYCITLVTVTLKHWGFPIFSDAKPTKPHPIKTLIPSFPTSNFYIIITTATYFLVLLWSTTEIWALLLLEVIIYRGKKCTKWTQLNKQVITHYNLQQLSVHLYCNME